MLITKLKPIDEIISRLGIGTTVICCEGCKEVYFPQADVEALLNRLEVERTPVDVISLTYACNKERLAEILNNFDDVLNRCDTVLVISCGVGVQTVSELFNSLNCNQFTGTSQAVFHDSDAVASTFGRTDDNNKVVLAACDTFTLPGFQGLMTSQCGCAMCGECHLNNTGGICPITACSKSLTAGQCGGAKKGMCEVDLSKECGWARITERLKLYR